MNSQIKGKSEYFKRYVEFAISSGKRVQFCTAQGTDIRYLHTSGLVVVSKVNENSLPLKPA